MTVDKITALLQKECGDSRAAEVNERGAQPAIRVAANFLLPVARLLHTRPECYFDLLSCITAIDNGPQAGSMEVVYRLYSIPFHQSLSVYVVLPRTPDNDNVPGKFKEIEGYQLPVIASVQSVWRTADWHEREAFDLMGIYFEGHPDMRRILLPADWKGFPLRKDYEQQADYHGIKVAY